MKRLLRLFLLSFLGFFFVGCSGEFIVDEPIVDELIIVETPIYVAPVIVDSLVTLFLLDEQGFSYANIPYICDSMNVWSQTAVDGAFSFYEGENCNFDFYGLDGDYSEPEFDDIVHIVDSLGYGQGGIAYDCLSFGASTTYSDGSFEYDIDDECKFYL